MVSSTPWPHFTPGKDPVPLTVGKSRPHRDSIPDRPARSQSLYRLSYPAHHLLQDSNIFQTTRCHVLQDKNIHSKRCTNIKSRTAKHEQIPKNSHTDSHRLLNSQVPERPVSVDFCANRNGVRIWSTILFQTLFTLLNC